MGTTLRPSFWRNIGTVTWTLLAIFAGVYTVALMLASGSPTMTTLALTAFTSCAGIIAWRRRGYVNWPVPKGNLLDVIRDQIAQQELSYPFFRNCDLDNLLGGQGGWTTQSAFRREKANLFAVGNGPIWLSQCPDPGVTDLLLIAKDDLGNLYALAFGPTLKFAHTLTYGPNNKRVFFAGYYGPVVFEPTTFGPVTSHA